MIKPSGHGPFHPHFIASQIREYRYFFLNLTPPQQSKLTVVCGGWERCAPDYRIDRNDLEFYCLEYVAAGSGSLTLHGIESKLTPGSVFAYEPFAPITIQTSEEDPLVKYFISFVGHEADSIIRSKTLGPHGVAHLHDAQPVQEAYEQLLETGRKGGSLAPRSCALLLELLSVRLEENAHVAMSVQSRARESFARCRTELQKHFRTIQSISRLAELSDLDPAYLTRLFYRFAGESPYDLLIRFKMNEAAAHLTGGRHTIKEIAAQVGYTDPYHFSRVFKKHYGITPSAFRHTRTRHGSSRTNLSADRSDARYLKIA